MRIRISIILFQLLLLVGCSGKTEKTGQHTSGMEMDRNLQFAKKFSIEQIGENSLLRVFSPWQNADNAGFSYIVGRDSLHLPDSLKNIPFIHAPVKKVVLMSTTFISFIDTLGVLNSVCGISGGQYVFNPTLSKRIQSAKVREVGYDNNMNYEVLAELNPDVVFMFGVQAGIVQAVNKLKEVGVQVVLCADYLEPHPLGRAEWLKFFSVFYEKEVEAAGIFNAIQANYQALLDSVSLIHSRPTVMMGLPWKDTWYIAGGESFAARLIEDAAGDYIFKDLKSSEAEPVDIESVFARGLEADIWINPGIATSLDMILSHDTRFELLKSYAKQQIFTNNKRVGANGGNDYWESGIIHPDLILDDLIDIFHGSDTDFQDLNYYFRLRKEADEAFHENNF